MSCRWHVSLERLKERVGWNDLQEQSDLDLTAHGLCVCSMFSQLAILAVHIILAFGVPA
jgi:hypothetical protein